MEICAFLAGSCASGRLDQEIRPVGGELFCDGCE